MKIYLAAQYSRRLELCGYHEQLVAMGHAVTSRWLDGMPHGVEATIEGGDVSQEAAEFRAGAAYRDIADIQKAECLINFAEPPESNASRGGRHVEMGFVLGLNTSYKLPHTRIIVVGHRENLFHWLPAVEFYEDWGQALEALT